jgi:YVTN family beta-propeller protein
MRKLNISAASILSCLALFTVSAHAQMLVVALSGDHQALLLDPTNYKTLATLPVGVNPHDLVISRDGRLAYLAIMGSQQEPGHSVAVLDLQQRTVKATFDTAPYQRCHDLRVSRDGARLWLTCAPSKAVIEMSAQTGKIRRTWKLDQDGAWMIAVTPDERKLYTANLEGKSVSVIDRRANTVRNLAFPSSQIGMDIAPDGRTLWVHHMESSTLSVIDVATDKVIATVPSAGKGFGRVKFTPAGKLVLVPQSESNNAALFDAARQRLLASIPLSAAPKVITISADSRRAFITSPATNQVLVIDIAARKEIATIPTGKAPDGIGWVESADRKSRAK